MNAELSKKKFQEVLAKYAALIKPALESYVDKLDVNKQRKKAVHYSLLNGGKLLRPTLVLMMANAIGSGYDVMGAALSVEFSHVSSLVVDDLPCMDDDNERRGMPALHKAFDESTALLVGFGLVAAAYQSLAENALLLRELPSPISEKAFQIGIQGVENLGFNTGNKRIIEGQFLDLDPPERNKELFLDVIHKKTVSLFEASLVLGWLFGGGDDASLPKVKEVAAHLGVAFQVWDDLNDLDQDKANHHEVNMASLLGVEAAVEMFHVEIDAYGKKVEELAIDAKELKLIADFLRTNLTQPLT